MAGWIRLKNFDHTRSVGHRQQLVTKKYWAAQIWTIRSLLEFEAASIIIYKYPSGSFDKVLLFDFKKTYNKDRMVHIYAAQYFLVTSYWRCPTDRVWSKFLSLIHCKVYNDNCLLNNFAVFKLRLKWLTLHKRGHYHRNNCCKQTLYS